MAKYQLLLPKMGESVAEATIIKWLKKPGDYIEADDAVMEIATDKVDSEVPSPVSGKLVEQLCKEDEVVQVGSVIAIIETEAAEEIQPVVQNTPQPQPEPEVIAKPAEQAPVAEPQNIPGTDQLEERVQAAAPQRNIAEFKSETRFYSPLVKHIALQENINIQELDSIPGSGAEGRLTKDDLLNYIRTKPAGSSAAPVTETPAEPSQPVQQETTSPQPQAEHP